MMTADMGTPAQRQQDMQIWEVVEDHFGTGSLVSDIARLRAAVDGQLSL